ncbi:MAG TPA: calcium-binding protein [Gaiellales bacterium]|nr:calcium-binding protein [Gaiellales bacterium]
MFAIVVGLVGAAGLVSNAQAVPASPAMPASVVDQSLTPSPTNSNLSAAINQCCVYVGQTFTAGLSGDLTGVNVSVGASTAQPLSDLRVAIRPVVDGTPGSTELGATVLNRSSSSMAQRITFATPIHVDAGQEYAIIVNYVGPDSTGGWDGSVDNEYTRGHLVDLNADGWRIEPTYDLFFRTFVRPLCAGHLATITGTRGSDILTGTPGDDVIVALSGNDTINAGGGNDVVCSGRGADTVDGGAGSDHLFGEGGNDLLRGGRGADLLDGGPGTDTCNGGAWIDTAANCETLFRIP